MRSRSSIVLAVLALDAAALFPIAAHAGWGKDPVAIRPTTASIPQVAACNDGGFGTFVTWQEEATAGSGVLRVQHLLPTGDLDPAWPSDGALACQRVAVRMTLGALPDRLGGVFVWWTESNGSVNVCVNRLESNGNVAAGWPSDGLSLGVVFNSWFRPSVIEDGDHGLFVAWTSGPSIHAHHLGPNGLATGGWPSSGRVVVPVDPATTYHLWPDLALADDGGVFLSWATWSWDTTVVESGMHLRRLTSAGLISSGWPPEGVSLAGFRPEPLGAFPGPPLLDIDSDGRGGVFALVGELEAVSPFIDSRLLRLTGDGTTSQDWPAQGFPCTSVTYYYNFNDVAAADAGLRVHSDGHDAAIVEYPNPYSDSPPIVGVSSLSNVGQVSWPISAVARGHEVVVKGDGGAVVADFKSNGPTSPWDWGAFFRVDQSLAAPTWTPIQEWHSEPLQHWFGDIALASTADVGAVLFWSQSIDRFGLFARRLGPAGEVTGVGFPRRPFALRGLRFDGGSGVVARVALPEGHARIELFDLAGRRLASRTIEGPATVDVPLPGTASLSPGVYFARLVSGAKVAAGKIAIAR